VRSHDNDENNDAFDISDDDNNGDDDGDNEM